ncbi:choline dehydrogenase [Brucella abortus 01-4165]|uniref:Glucose-methanol-choline oxidoreductase:NAD binding site:GMC oxidoreductase n=4 Tax=Brucella abortus TaxID=235 RepID=Q2YMS7_BRUA2|nr:MULTISPECIES: choline dehydrogenase [Brucella]EPF79052.1 choline dehydrogenase [Brucella abortus B10-0973]EPF84144.1 choline dehydrogenase [Brucella abortus B10-0091]EPF87102.1 choline dehydrogenase [Brucella abortus B10-0018]EPF91917.1 choline dehydrogenase [Brucella abortus 01-0648]EPF94622.1 choline dehydrogenase [Brucella abortus 94-1313]EPF99185.1 choline dehydrogenase [Brucella abortus 90-1280]EPF99959.1 choline dehydrogenase [Brucella abortus 90-0737]EPG05067.1 choline dehydrogena
MEADFVIIGSGSAGSAMAYRLSEDGRYSVIVIEYGVPDVGPLIQMPAALSFPMNMETYDWGFSSEPEPHIGGRSLVTPRGKVLGGSSSINGMVYVRGHACDFDHWSQSGARGWAYADVLPYFKRMENSQGGQEGWRGTNGPLYVQRGKRDNPLFHAFVEAGHQAGFEVTDDYNGEKQEGFGPMEQTIHNGRRWSAANAYLKPALKRPNVKLVKGFARKIVLEGKRAVGVEIEAGRTFSTIRARREVIIAASSINSPKLLMLSGIGPAAHLKEHGIDLVADRPGVGQNLQDHLEVYIQQECTQPITLYSKLNLFSKARIGVEWLLFKTGDGATNHFESAAFVRSKAGVEYPDIQYHFLPVAIRYDGKAAAQSHGFQAHVGPMRSKSRGSVTLRSANPREKPVIKFNYMSHEDDWADFRHCVRLTRESSGRPRSIPIAERKSSRAPMCRRTMKSTISSASMSKARSIHAAPAKWRRLTIRWPWSILNAASSASKACALRIHPSSRASPTAISTAHQSWWAKRRPTTFWAARRSPAPIRSRGSIRGGRCRTANAVQGNRAVRQ